MDDCIQKYLQTLKEDDRYSIHLYIIQLDATQQNAPYRMNFVIERFFSVILGNDDPDKEEKLTNLKAITDKLNDSGYFNHKGIVYIIANCLKYIRFVDHKPEFKKYYVDTFIDDNMGAYDSRNISCAQGIFERFYTTLEATLQLAVHYKELAVHDKELAVHYKESYGINQSMISYYHFLAQTNPTRRGF